MRRESGIITDLEELKAISFFSTSLYTKSSVEEVLWDITKNVIHRLGFVDCVVYTFDKQKQCLLQKAAYGPKNPSGNTIYNRIKIPLGEGIVGSVGQSETPVLITDTRKDSRYIIDDAERLSEICIPIIVNDKLFGIIDSEHPDKNFFNEKHVHLLTIIAALCSQKIKDLEKRSKNPFTKANEYLKKLEALLRVKKIYRDPYLSLSSTAELLGISACYLSSMVNAITNSSFIDYINKHRVADIKQNLLCDRYSHYTIVSVGLEAGFNSKSAFYNAFKKHTGITPNAYREQHLMLS